MEVESQEVALSPADEAADEAAFNAAFAATRDEPLASGGDAKSSVDHEEPPAPAAEDPAAIAAAAEAARLAAEADAQAKAQAEANAPVAMTKAELDQMRAALATIPQLQRELASTRDSTAGKLGSMKQLIEDVKVKASQGQRPNLKQMKRLEAEFPELADMFKADLEDAYGTAPSEPAADAVPAPAAAEPVDPMQHPDVVKVLQKESMATVEARHPGWQQMRATQEFQQWRNQLPPTAQNLLSTTWDSGVISDALTDFKGWQARQAEAKAATAATAAQAAANAQAASKQRDNRLANAVPATTGAPTGVHAVDDDAAFESGFKSARGR